MAIETLPMPDAGCPTRCCILGFAGELLSTRLSWGIAMANCCANCREHQPTDLRAFRHGNWRRPTMEEDIGFVEEAARHGSLAVCRGQLPIPARSGRSTRWTRYESDCSVTRL